MFPIRVLSATFIVTVALTAFAINSPGTLAAPPNLPVCGHNSISGTPDVRSGPPDIAVSGNGQNVAVVWAEGTNTVGIVRLAYSTMSTSDNGWRYMLIDTGTDNQEPTVVFDPVNNSIVHIAYQDGTDAGSSKITYAKCTLGGGCAKKSSNTEAGKVLRSAQVAVNANGDPVIVYQKADTNPSIAPLVFYGYITNDGTGTFQQNFSIAGSTRQENPTAVYANNKVHIAYAASDSPSNLSRIEYVNLNVSGNLSSGALSPSPPVQFFPAAPTEEPDFPSIDASGNSIVLVWQFENKSTANEFYLAYNTSSNGGTTWSNSTSYKYIPSNNSAASPGGSDSRRSPFGNNLLIDGLRPNVMLDTSTGATRYHVVWHENDSGGRDVMYSLFEGGQWTNTAIVETPSPIPPASDKVTNITELYRLTGNDAPPVDDPGSLFNVRPKVHFSPTGNRLQVVYSSDTGGVTPRTEVRYNGWQLGQPGATDPLLEMRDMDCDHRSDTTEFNFTPSCPGNILEDTYNKFDCDADEIPDFLDINVDNDWLTDEKESNENWRVFNNPNQIFLPVFTKAS